MEWRNNKGRRRITDLLRGGLRHVIILFSFVAKRLSATSPPKIREFIYTSRHAGRHGAPSGQAG
eukprot:2660352-Prymnesium_polylepis.1